MNTDIEELVDGLAHKVEDLVVRVENTGIPRPRQGGNPQDGLFAIARSIDNLADAVRGK